MTNPYRAMCAEMKESTELTGAEDWMEQYDEDLTELAE